MVLSVIGIDRPGQLEILAGVVEAHEGNWLESRMSNLAGRFAGIVRVSLPTARGADFEIAIRALNTPEMSVLIETAPSTEAAVAVSPYRLHIVGHDRPGIVHEFSAALAKRGINIFDMRSDITSAPMSGDPLFIAQADVHVPASIDLNDLRDHLESIADELLIEYTLEPLD